MFNFSSGDNKVQKEEVVEVKECKEIILKFTSENIIISSTSEDKLRIVETSNSELKDEEKFTCHKNGTKIEIIQGEHKPVSSLFNLGGFNRKVEVFIPKSYKNDLEVSSRSGNLKINDDLNLNSIRCELSSGNLKSNGNLASNEIELKVSSGNMSVKEVLTKKYVINAASGNVNIDSISGSGEVEARSGNIEMTYKDIAEYSTVKANSGNVKLNVPRDLSFDFTGECGSGDIRSTFDINYKNRHGSKATVAVGLGPYKKITVNTGSGNINLREKEK